MDSKHTPGPWHAKAGVTQMCDSDSTTVARGRPHGSEGAFWWIFSPYDHGDAEADARLLAAAPDLLEALQRALNVLYATGAMTEANAARDAIARATGSPA